MSDDGYRKYRRFFEQPPLLVIEWRDSESEARGWLVINSLRGGATGGGTRMGQDVTREEATFLAKTMEIKFNVSGPPIGGAKSVIRFDPADRERKPGVLRRWYRGIAPYLRECYGTGGDLGVNEVREVMPLTAEAIGLGHPQEGIVRGHFAPGAEALQRILNQLRTGVELKVKPAGLNGRELTIAGLITGYGIAVASRTYYRSIGETLARKRVLIEGFGDVGGPSALYLEQSGARIVGIISRTHDGRYRWRVDSYGLEISELLLRRESSELPPGGVESDDPEPFWQTPADLFVPAAASHLITMERLARLRAAGVELIVCGANNPFNGQSLGDLSVQRFADQNFAVIPDFIANSGMARTFAYLMKEGARVEEAAIEADVTRTIEGALERLLAGYAGGGGLLDRAFALYVPEVAGSSARPPGRTPLPAVRPRDAA